MDDEDHQNNSPVPTRRDLESEDSEDEDPESEELEDEDLKGEDSKDEESEYENSEYEDSEDGDSEYEGLNLGFGDLDLEDESSVDEDPDDEDSEYEDLEDEDSEDEDFPDLDSEDLDLEDEDLGNENPEDQDCENKNLDTDRLPCEFCEKWPNVLVHEATKSNDNEEAIILPYVAENWHGDPRLVFHGSCSTCADAIDEDDDELCDFCRHLRLRHLLLCNNHIFSYWTGMGACMGTVKEVYDRKYEEDCSMCGLITRVISYLEAQGIDGEDIKDEEVLLWFKGSRLVLRTTRRKDGSFRTWYFGHRLRRSGISKSKRLNDRVKTAANGCLQTWRSKMRVKQISSHLFLERRLTGTKSRAGLRNADAPTGRVTPT